MPFLLAEILNFQGSTHRIGVGSFSHIKNIRNKLQAFDYAPIKTIWGVGYKWEK